jgi:hypothetical protein
LICQWSPKDFTNEQNEPVSIHKPYEKSRATATEHFCSCSVASCTIKGSYVPTTTGTGFRIFRAINSLIRDKEDTDPRKMPLNSGWERYVARRFPGLKAKKFSPTCFDQDLEGDCILSCLCVVMVVVVGGGRGNSL